MTVEVIRACAPLRFLFLRFLNADTQSVPEGKRVDAGDLADEVLEAVKLYK